MAEITMRGLLQAGAHFGHRTRYWSPKMKPYIFGERDKIHIINLEKTLPMLHTALDYLGGVVAAGGKVLFVGTKRQASQAVREQAVRCGSPYVDHRWLGGMLTNYKTVKNSITRLKELEQTLDSAIKAGMSKKEALTLSRERAKLDRALHGIKDMDGLPEALFVIDIQHEAIAVAEAKKLGLAVVAVVDTNCAPDAVDYVIPGNDDSRAAIRLFVEAAADSIMEARLAAQQPVIAAGDEYVEVDDRGEAVATRAAAVAKPGAGETAVKVTVKKSRARAAAGQAAAVKPAPAAKKPAPEKPARSPAAATETAAEKPAHAATTATKKVAPAKSAATVAAKKTTAKKTAAKKTATKKTTAKKAAAKPAADQQ